MPRLECAGCASPDASPRRVADKIMHVSADQSATSGSSRSPLRSVTQSMARSVQTSAGRRGARESITDSRPWSCRMYAERGGIWVHVGTAKHDIARDDLAGARRQSHGQLPRSCSPSARRSGAPGPRAHAPSCRRRGTRLARPPELPPCGRRLAAVTENATWSDGAGSTRATCPRTTSSTTPRTRPSRTTRQKEPRQRRTATAPWESAA